MAETSDKNQKAVGRRKEASARVKIEPGKGSIKVNDKDYKKYFPTKIWQQIVIAPLWAIGKQGDYDVNVRVLGGGVKGQAEAVRHGIARALVAWNADFRPILKSHGFLTRDSRAKERKKPGLYKARRGHQWRKR